MTDDRMPAQQHDGWQTSALSRCLHNTQYLCLFCLEVAPRPPLIPLSFMQLFRGNRDSHAVKVSYLEHPVRARFLRVHVDDWHVHPSLRMEIIGCQAISSQPNFDHDFSSSTINWSTLLYHMLSSRLCVCLTLTCFLFKGTGTQD